MARNLSHRTATPAADSGIFWMVAALLLGLGISVIGFFAVMMWADARDSNSSSAATTLSSMDGVTSAATGALQSFAGAAPPNADELATAHKPFPAALLPAPAGPVANVDLKLTDITVQVAQKEGN